MTRSAHWNNESTPLRVWVAGAEGWTIAASVTLNAVLLNCSPQPRPTKTANVASTSITDFAHGRVK